MLRVMTWNIRTGGRDRGGSDRLDRVVQVIAEQAPDVLALQELRGFDRNGLMAAVAGRVGMTPHLARSCLGQPVAVLVRPPLRIVDAGALRRPFHHAAARVVVGTSAGPLTVLSTHLYPYSGGRRRMEAEWLAAAARRAPGPLTLIAGDLNSLDPTVDHTERLAGMPALYRRRHLRRIGDDVDTRAVARLLAAGLVDLWPSSAAGAPEADGLTVPTRFGGEEFAGMRLDYLLGSPASAQRVRDCRVIRGGAADTASDHYPLLAELDLSAD
ncbi:endonuclease/exonuclease/phosphatase family protein [Micromonospora sp. STR1_7]|uniref:Endonuclease/exonuclease/phosphatase family protein n=1 Tax=Micromonospora parastrephiae TaxID=2806101 RepID=A0ABS1XPQ3_9ACTN|nr:endonuclease/exonuclease/phosphatase family protein [Micromonospora parastrephiae]MBM0231239.1 endonuclease/exonuclease/phosphatase family protein [Micromonospora parastrephiae]